MAHRLIPARPRPQPTLMERLADSLDWVFVALILWLGLVLALMPSQAAAQGSGAFTIEENGRSFATLQQAVDAIGDARATILIAPGTYRQCAVQRAGVVLYAARENGSVTFDTATCEGKAALVLRGLGAEVRGITFTSQEEG